MTDPVPASSDPQSPSPSTAGMPGASVTVVASIEDLVRARESRGLSVADIAQRIKVSPRRVQALERGEFGDLPGMVFVLGVLRLYGRVLQVDVGPLVASFGSPKLADNLKPVTTLQEPLPRSGSLGFGGGGRGSLLAWIGLGIIAAVSLVLFFGQGPDAPTETPVSRTLTVEAVDASSPPSSASPTPTAPTAPTAPSTPSVSTDSTVSAASSISSPSAASPDGAAQVVPAPVLKASTQGSESPQGASPGQPAVWVLARDDAWIEIRQSDGRVLHTGTVGRGQSIGVDGQAPFSLIIGNATEVELRFRGGVVPLQAGANNIARLTLP